MQASILGMHDDQLIWDVPDRLESVSFLNELVQLGTHSPRDNPCNRNVAGIVFHSPPLRHV